jgi:predicted nucleic acid-binding protein
VHRLFLDANVLFSAAYRKGAPLRRLWGRRGVELLTSAYAIAEAERHVEGEQRGRLAELLKAVRVVSDVPTQELPEGMLLRSKDVPILAAAIAARATHLITGDRRDFGVHYGRRVGGVLIQPPRDYLQPPRRKRRRTESRVR